MPSSGRWGSHELDAWLSPPVDPGHSAGLLAALVPLRPHFEKNLGAAVRVSLGRAISPSTSASVPHKNCIEHGTYAQPAKLLCCLGGRLRLCIHDAAELELPKVGVRGLMIRHLPSRTACGKIPRQGTGVRLWRLQRYQAPVIPHHVPPTVSDFHGIRAHLPLGCALFAGPRRNPVLIRLRLPRKSPAFRRGL